MAGTEPDHVRIGTLEELSLWLSAHHASGQSAWLITGKKHTDHYLDYGDIIDELLCWGWVDSRTKRIDDDWRGMLVSPRNPGSAWSAINKDKVARLRAEGRMTPAGEALVAAAQANGMWAFLDDVERLEVPTDLARALEGLEPVWDGWPRSIKRGTLEWIKTAKRPETRAKRIAEVAQAARQGQRPAPLR